MHSHALPEEVAAKADPSPAEVLGALSALPEARRRLDAAERDLIESARQRGSAWAQIAAALGLASRQAAEQRWLRLNGEQARDAAEVRAERQRLRLADEGQGAAMRTLRTAAVAAYRQMCADAFWDRRHPRARLARVTLQAATVAEPGALFALVEQVVDDLDAVRHKDDDLPVKLEAAVHGLRSAAAAARPRS